MSNVRSTLVSSLALFACAFITLFLLTADVFHPSMDEGIYLEGASRVVTGQVPYRDFFAYTGPLIYWLQALLEMVFGRNLPMLRLSVALSFGLCTAGVCAMVSMLRGWRPGVVAGLVFFGLTSYSLYRFTIGHRWLSAGLFSVAAVLALHALLPLKHRSRVAFGAGFFAAAAAWATPTFVVPMALILLWFPLRAREQDGRRQGLFYLAGAVAASLPAAAWLIAHGALVPMFDNLVWASSSYRRANTVWYGYYPGFKLTAGIRHMANQFRLGLPALLIPICLVLAMVEVWRRKRTGAEELLAVIALGMFLTSYPRWDVNQLLYVTMPFYALIAVWIHDVPVASFGRAVATASLIVSAAFGSFLTQQVDSFTYFDTRVGRLRHVPESGLALEALEKRILPRASILVFPYMPVLSWALDGRNVTSYSYLQPGMMSAEDERRMLAQLKANPPDYILRQYLPDEQVLTVWPNSDPARMDFNSIEQFMMDGYEDVDRIRALNFDIRVLVRAR